MEPLKLTLEAHHRSLEELESAHIEVDEALSGRAERLERPQQDQQQGGGSLDLLSITDVCQELGMGKS